MIMYLCNDKYKYFCILEVFRYGLNFELFDV